MKYDIRIASPCTANWYRMAGDDRVRHCAQCNLDVFNLSAMTPAEISALLERREGRICARFYQRKDGTMLTQNCPVGMRQPFRQASRIAASFLSAVFVLGPDFAAAQPQKQTTQLAQIKPAPAPLILIVQDISGAVVANAKVELTNESTAAETAAETTEAGELRLPGLPHAKYKIVIKSPGFRTFTVDHISLPARTPPKYTLEIGALMGVLVIDDHRNPIQKLVSRLRRAL